MEEKLSIKVNVAERFYPLKVDHRDEEKIRKAARMINEKLLQYKQRYTDKDLQDFLAMAALQFVIKLLECESTTSVSPVIDKLRDLDTQLGEYLSAVKE
jgi:cell division protein ZapA (FtsZ GTPase activity inhibitor)